MYHYISNYGTSFPVLSYLGSSDTDIVRTRVTDLLSDGDFPNLLNLEQIATVPNELAHGIVWKVLVNGYDAQDEYASLDALGVGTHEFKVYFNREMDTTVDPQLHMVSPFHTLKRLFLKKVLGQQMVKFTQLTMKLTLALPMVLIELEYKKHKI